MSTKQALLSLTAVSFLALVACGEDSNTPGTDGGGGGGAGGGAGAGGAGGVRMDASSNPDMASGVDAVPQADMASQADAAPPPGCNAITPDCPTGQRCLYRECALKCFQQGTTMLAHGAACDETMMMNCSPGHDCIALPPAEVTMRSCHKYCYNDADCPAGKTCSQYGPGCNGAANPLGLRLCNL